MRTDGAGASWHADLALICITLIWGATFVVVKEALDYSSVLLFLALRFSLAAVALALVFRRRYPTLFQRRAAWRGGIAAGLCLFAGFFLQTLGLRYTTASKSAFITGLAVVLVPSLGTIVYRKGPRWQEVLGVLVATAGLGLLTLQGHDLRIGEGDLLKELLKRLGCSSSLFFLRPLGVTLGENRDSREGGVVDPTSAAPSQGVGLARAEGPGARRLFPDTPVVPPTRWAPLQQKRVRYR